MNAQFQTQKLNTDIKSDYYVFEYAILVSKFSRPTGVERNIVNEWGQNKVSQLKLKEKTTSRIPILLFPKSDSFLSL